MENRPSLNETIRRAAVERMWLQYFNTTLLEKGLISPGEHHKMQVQIAARKAPPPQR